MHARLTATSRVIYQNSPPWNTRDTLHQIVVVVCLFVVSDHFWFRLCFTYFKNKNKNFFLFVFFFFWLYTMHLFLAFIVCLQNVFCPPWCTHPYWLTGRETSSYLRTYFTCSPEALSESMVLSCPNRTANVVPDRWAQTWIIDRQCRDLFATITRHSVPSNWAWQDSGSAHRHFPQVKLVGGNSK